jgi:hypothetical protein
MRFRMARPETIGGWESVIADPLGGVCRSAFGWTDGIGNLNLSFGTHATLELFQGGELFDLTPTLALPSFVLGTDPLAVTNLLPTVVVTATAHGLTTGDSVTLSGSTAVGGITPNGTFTVTVNTVNQFQYTFTSNATSTASGGGSAVVIAPQAAFADGQIDGTGSNGYGTGAYGIGGYGEPSETENFPRTWSQGSLGQSLIAAPRGGTIYAWDGDTTLNAEPIRNAPARVNFVLVTPQGTIMAIGCSEEITGTFNPFCIRHSSVAGNDPLIRREEWNTDTDTTARQYILQGSGEPVAGRVMGEYVLVWTTDGLFVGTFVGQAAQQIYRFDRAPGAGGLIGPNAVVVRGGTALWLGPDLQFYTYTLGGEVTPLECPIRTDLAENIAAAQGAKVHASTLSSWDEAYFFYPDERDGSGLECSRYVARNIGQGVDGGSWFRGEMDRTAGIDAGPASYPCRVSPAGQIYWHERGHSADGSALSYFIKSGALLADEDNAMMAVAMWPDFDGQLGPISMTIYTSYKPREASVVKGPYAIAPDAEKIDVRASGRYFALQYAGSSAPAYVRVQDSVFELRGAGGR